MPNPYTAQARRVLCPLCEDRVYLIPPPDGSDGPRWHARGGVVTQCPAEDAALLDRVASALVERDDGLRALLLAYDAQGTCSNLGCDPFHVHRRGCVWPRIMERLR